MITAQGHIFWAIPAGTAPDSEFLRALPWFPEWQHLDMMGSIHLVFLYCLPYPLKRSVDNSGFQNIKITRWWRFWLQLGKLTHIDYVIFVFNFSWFLSYSVRPLMKILWNFYTSLQNTPAAGWIFLFTGFYLQYQGR